jgi:hypothetical protein
MERRDFLMAGAAGATALALTGAPAAAKHHGMKKASGVDRSLKGDTYDLSIPAANREIIAKINGNTDMKSNKYGWFKGIVQGVRPGEGLRDLVGFTGFSVAKLLPMLPGEGEGYRKILNEVGFYTDLKTGEILEEWHNPYLDEKVRVVPIANPAFNHTITDYYYQPPSYGGLNEEIRPKRPFILDWDRRDNDLTLAQRINLFYPAALQPDKWPRESGSKFNQVTENFLYNLNWDDIQNPDVTSLSARGTWMRTTPWLPWMLMGPTEGHCSYSCFFGAEDSIEYADPVALEYAAKNYPEYLEMTATWDTVSLSSLEWYAREQKPAPLRADGTIPVAKPPAPFGS